MKKKSNDVTGPDGTGGPESVAPVIEYCTCCGNPLTERARPITYSDAFDKYTGKNIRERVCLTYGCIMNRICVSGHKYAFFSGKCKVCGRFDAGRFDSW